jgi:hypothetical protein
VSGRLAVENPIFTPMAPPNDDIELLPELRMKWMRDTYRASQILGVSCS